MKPPQVMLLPSEPLCIEKDLREGENYYVQPKMDGVRIKFFNGIPFTRSGKRLPNRALEEAMIAAYRESKLNSLDIDGELMLWNKTTQWWDPFNTIQSVVMSKMDKLRPEISTAWSMIVFDYDSPWCFEARLAILRAHRTNILFPVLSTKKCFTLDEVQVQCILFIGDAYEGAIVRSARGFYKHGRCTTQNHIAWKYVDWVRDEAKVIAKTELMHNLEPTTKHKENLYRGFTLGSLLVEHPRFGQFEIGTGFTDLQRKVIWDDTSFVGKAITFKYRPGHIKNKPCPAVYVGVRMPEDML